MPTCLRPYATAGVALIGASVIAITPVAPPMPDVQVASPAVQLSASVDPITPWIDMFNASSANATELAQAYFNAPLPLLQQVIVNQMNYLGQLLNDPASFGDVIEDVGDNLQALFQTATFLGLDMSVEANVMKLAQSNDQFHSLIAAFLPSILPTLAPDLDETAVNLILQAVNFLASPASGVLMGFVGPFISPVVAVLNSIQEIAGAENFEAALQALVSMPANVVGSVFNGATLDLNGLVPLIAGAMPEGMSLTSLSLAFGGLLSVGGTYVGVGSDFTDPAPVPGIGGSILNSLGLGVDLGGFVLDMPANPIGPLGALTNLTQMLANAIGWDGNGNPLTELTFPALDTTPEPPAPEVVPESVLNAEASVLTLDVGTASEQEAPAKLAPAADPATLKADPAGDSEPAARGSILAKLFPKKDKAATNEASVQSDDTGNSDAVTTVGNDGGSSASNAGNDTKQTSVKATKKVQKKAASTE